MDMYSSTVCGATSYNASEVAWKTNAIQTAVLGAISMTVKILRILPARQILRLLVLGALVVVVAPLLASQKTLRISSLDPKSGILGADISPDNRFVAIYSVSRAGSTRDSGKREDVYELQIWEWRTHELTSRKVLYREPSKMLGITPRFVRYADGGSKLAVYEQGHLLVLNAATLASIQDVDLDMSHWPWFETNIRRDRITKENISDLEVDVAARRAAVLIPWGTHAGGEVRVYDLVSGQMIRKWDFVSGVKDGGSYESGLAFYSSRPISISPDGKKLAISLGLPVPEEGTVPSQEKNVLVLDIDSGETTAAINTGYLAGPICFVPGNQLELATLSLYFHEKAPETNSIKLWNAQTGALSKEIRASRYGIGEAVDVSADGRIIMSFSNRLKYDFSWLGQEYGAKIYDPRIRLWDLATGKELAISPSILHLLSAGFSHYFRLSADGNVVLLYTNVYRAEKKTEPEYQLYFLEIQ